MADQRKQKKRAKYGKWSANDMERALVAVRAGEFGLNAAAKRYNVPKATLKRHMDFKNKFANGPVRQFGRSTVLPVELEEELVEHVLKLESMFFGLTRRDLMSLAFQLADRNDIRHVFNKDKARAGKDWFKSFLKRHPQITLRQPEATSLARASGFNRESVNKFFNMLEDIIDTNSIDATRVFNMDESGLTTVQRPQRILAMKGKRQVGAMTSAERGINTTVVCCVSAAGQYVPPMILFKRKRMKDELQDGAPPGSLVLCNESGWMDQERFLLWIEHFVSVVKPSTEKPVLLIMDGHSSHTKNPEAINLAREHGLILLSLPPHTTHRLQPLDVAFFKPMNTYYDQAIERWLRDNPGRGITTFQVSKLFGEGYIKAATMANAVSGFAKCGIWPCTRDVFNDHEFQPSALSQQATGVPMVTSVPGPIATTPMRTSTSTDPDPIPGTSTDHLGIYTAPDPVTPLFIGAAPDPVTTVVIGTAPDPVAPVIIGTAPDHATPVIMPIGTAPDPVTPVVIGTAPDPVTPVVIGTAPDPATPVIMPIGTAPDPVAPVIIGTAPDHATPVIMPIGTAPDPVTPVVIGTAPDPVTPVVIGTAPDPATPVIMPIGTAPDHVAPVIIGTAPDHATPVIMPIGTAPDPVTPVVIGTAPDPVTPVVIGTAPDPATPVIMPIGTAPDPVAPVIIGTAPDHATPVIMPIGTAPDPVTPVVIGTAPDPVTPVVIGTAPDPATPVIMPIGTAPDHVAPVIIGTAPDHATPVIMPIGTAPDPATPVIIGTAPDPVTPVVIGTAPDPVIPLVIGTASDPAIPSSIGTAPDLATTLDTSTATDPATALGVNNSKSTCSNTVSVTVSDQANILHNPSTTVDRVISEVCRPTPQKVILRRVRLSVTDISPIPRKVLKVAARQTRKSEAQILTSSPYKEALLIAKEGAKPKGNSQCKRPINFGNTVASKAATKNARTTVTRSMPAKSGGKGGKNKGSKAVSETVSDESDWFCFMCTESTMEDMVQCQQCESWVHTECANIGDNPQYVCELCEN